MEPKQNIWAFDNKLKQHNSKNLEHQFPLAKNKTSESDTLDTMLSGAMDGALIGFDIIGAVYTRVTNKKTIGGSGLNGLAITKYDDGTINLSDADHTSIAYKFSKICGVSTGLMMQLGTYGGIQIATIVANHIVTKNDKQQN